MSDRELLELAAKAAGLAVHARHQANRDAFGAGDMGLWISDVTTCWNPLNDDGDALRLAIKLGLAVVPYVADVAALHNASGRSWAELRGNDTYAATRRAIVRAAAEIGRTL